MREELNNSLRMQERYEQELAKPPKGTLVRRRVRGHDNYYHITIQSSFEPAFDKTRGPIVDFRRYGGGVAPLGLDGPGRGP